MQDTEEVQMSRYGAGADMRCRCAEEMQNCWCRYGGAEVLKRSRGLEV